MPFDLNQKQTTIMTTVIEKDSSAPAIVLICVVIILMIGGAGLGFGYMNGTFGPKATAIEKNKKVESKTVISEKPL